MRFNSCQCLSLSDTEPSWLAVGHATGNVSLIDLDKPHDAELVQISVRQQRASNAVALSGASQLAVGLDKVRSDACLMIWDVSRSSSHAELVSSYAASESVLSTRFFADQPHVLAAGVNYRWLRMFDTREHTNRSAVSYPTPCVHNVDIDTFNTNYIASRSEDVVAVFDRRYPTEAVLSLRPTLRDKRDCVADIAYSEDRAGKLIAMTKFGSFHFWEFDYLDNLPSMSTTIIPKARRNSYRSVNVLPIQDRVYVAATDSITPAFATSSFDVRPKHCSAANSMQLLISDEQGSFTTVEINRARTALSSSARNQIALARGTDCEMIGSRNPVPSMDRAKTLAEAVRRGEDVTSFFERLSVTDTMSEYSEATARASRTHDDGADGDDDGDDDTVGRGRVSSTVFPPEKVLRDDIIVDMMSAAQMGYMFDCDVNTALAHDEYQRDMWQWIKANRNLLLSGQMTTKGFDFGFQGVLGIWHLWPAAKSRRKARARHYIRHPYSPRLDRETTRHAVAAIQELNSRSGRDIYVACRSRTGPARQLALATCGFDFSLGSLEQEIERLEREHKYEKAAGLALCHGRIERCVYALAKGNERLKLMSTALAGFVSATHEQRTENSLWKKLCRDLSIELDEPYLRAIFAYAANSDWKDILDEQSLPLKERLGLALRFLSDEDMTNYLTDLCKIVVATGDLEGIMLTGLTPLAFQLLQNYVDRTSDVQTAAIIASYVIPRYYDDQRYDRWVDAYRLLLNRWQLYYPRARFDVARAEQVPDKSRSNTTQSSQQSIFVRCQHCNQSISHKMILPSRTRDGKRTTTVVAQAGNSLDKIKVSSRVH